MRLRRQRIDPTTYANILVGIHLAPWDYSIESDDACARMLGVISELSSACRIDRHCAETHAAVALLKHQQVERELDELTDG